MALGAAAFAVVGTANAQINVTADITTATTWTTGNVYDLRDVIHVTAGATLTIQPGVIVATSPGAGDRALVVDRGGQIFVQGRWNQPVIMTSTADQATWPSATDASSGTWREASDEWGNLTLQGNAFISENAFPDLINPTNVPTCNAGNMAQMEGLVADFPGDPKVLYGGGDDDDDSGSISYLSLRYGGSVLALNVELNGLSLGGIGRETDIDHVEIMNNLDDGVEIWGGTVNLKNLSIWNIGDDSLDIDQGYRGEIQFGLIVQGYSVAAGGGQGSGVGDNAIETDGAENSDWQPVTTTKISNFTVIGQPIDGDGLTAWRDNARVQHRNSIFMDGGETLVRFDDIDGDGAQGYGHNGTLTWAQTWATAYNAAPAHVNDCPAGTYTVQTDGNLSEIRNSVFFRNLNGSAYTEATTVGVFNPALNNVTIPGFAAVDAPIQSITRGPQVTRGGKQMLPVTGLDPRPANEALTSTESATTYNGCFSEPRYRGGFSPRTNWCRGWTAADAFGFFTSSDDANATDLGVACPGTNGDMELSVTGDQGTPNGVTISVTNALPNSNVAFIYGTTLIGDVLPGGFDLFGCDLLVLPINAPAVPTDANGEWTFSNWGGFPTPTTLYYTVAQLDFGGTAGGGIALSNTVAMRN